MTALVAVNLPIDKLFSYTVPPELADLISVGKRVRVPFTNREIVGYVVGIDRGEATGQLKPIHSIIDDEPLVNEEMLELSRIISEEFFSSWGEAIQAMIPAGLKKGKTQMRPRADIAKDSRTLSDSIAPSNPLELTGEQRAALNRIVGSIDAGEHAVYLLHGITASGKTEVYLQAIDHVLKKGKGAICLVPEISLTPQAQERFIARFGKRVAVLHSRLTQGMRYFEWKRIREGTADIVVGARSAIFCPMKRVGLIVVDEEHETSYKQEDVPRYHAREVAEIRARINRCPLILGSATPSLESYYKAKQGTFTLLTLTRRIDNKIMPKVKIVDMRMELATRKRVEIFSKVLLDAVEKTAREGKQAIIFLNRRGYSTFVNCRRCGFVLKCKRCDTALVYHFENKRLMCHYCSYQLPPPKICPECKSGYVQYVGLGTEKVESEMTRRFPYQLHIARMDSDTTSKRGSHDRILGDFRSGDVKVLIGTQMIAKGLDFPDVTLVGVVSADVMMNLPDFRASERTFNLLTQVAGRAGRGDKAGEVIVQTYAPEHYSILAAAKHDYEKFYEKEIVMRKELELPPFTHLIKITVRSRQEALAQETAQALARDITRSAPRTVKIVGPAPAPIARMRGYYRYNILVKARERKVSSVLLKEVLSRFRRSGKVLIAVDVDPVSM